jgi:serine/threonine-protein kinase
MIGQTLGHYRILEKVAAGGMGVVYRARDEQLERDVAVKLLPSGTLRDEKSRRSFRKEALALAKLNHPNIETVYDFGTQDDLDFLVMEYVPGKTLADRLAGGTLPEKDVIALGIQIASALEEAHDRGIVHRDLKPANVALTARGYAKILDFGLARLLRPADDATTQTVTDSDAAAGTLPYMPPEQLRGEAVDARADIYSLGAVLFEMCTGHRAFHDALASRLIDAILHQPAVPPRALNTRLSPELERIVLKCLDKDPDRRYQSVKELLVDLRRLQLAASGELRPSLQARSSHAALRWAAYGTLLLLAFAAGAFAFNFAGLRDRLSARPRAPQIRSLAVLPFENLSGNSDQDYFADGITEALITDLGQLQSLRVISRTSVMRYKSARKPLDQIARELHVDAIVEGSVYRSGGLTRATARLVYGPTDSQLWSRSYQADSQNVPGLLDDVASAIVHEIDLSLTPLQQAQFARERSVNPAAHEAYLKGNYLLRGTPEQMRRAKELFEEALRVDPNYAQAYAGMADFYYWSALEMQPRVVMPQAAKYAQKALELDPRLAHGYLTLGAVSFFGDWNWTQAESYFRRAIELNPNDAEAHRTYSSYLAAMGRGEEALAEVRRSQELDPLYITTQITAGWVFYYAGQYEMAVAECKKALELDSNSAGAYDCLGSGYRAEGMLDQAIAACLQAVALSKNDPSRAIGLGQAYAAAGRTAEAQKISRDLREFSTHNYVPPFLLARLHIALGEREPALARLEEAYESRDPHLTWLRAERAFDPLRSDPRFRDLSRRVGFPP